jgi:hypothetical protein
VLPYEQQPLNDEEVNNYVRNQISKYYSELEVEPYKSFFTKDKTLKISKSRGFARLADFEEFLENHNDNDGIENGLYYWITTYNTQGRWDSFRIDGIKKACDLANALPYSVVTLDGVWHSEMDFGHKPILDFEVDNLHPDNIKPEEKWKKYLEDFFKEHSDYYLAILHVHS